MTQLLANAEIDFDNLKYLETIHATPVDVEIAYITEVGLFHPDKINKSHPLGPQFKIVDLSPLTDYMEKSMPHNQTTLLKWFMFKLTKKTIFVL